MTRKSLTRLKRDRFGREKDTPQLIRQQKNIIERQRQIITSLQEDILRLMEENDALKKVVANS